MARGVVEGAGADPVAGRCCMNDEFDSTDSNKSDGGIRSSALYAFEEAMNLTTTRATMTALGSYGSGPQAVDDRMSVGMTDLMWKLDVGYISEALNQEQVLDTETLPTSDGPASKGYLFIQDIWQAYLTGPHNGLH